MFAALIAALLFTVPYVVRSGQVTSGIVTIPYLFGDGGIVALQAGVYSPVTWNDPPPNAALYLLLWDSHYSPYPALIGLDVDASDGVVVQWKVPERLSGMPFGVALYTDGRIIQSETAWLEYGSGTAPPEGGCTVGYSGMDGANLFGGDHPSTDIYLGDLEGYAPVLERVTDVQGVEWFRIVLSEETVYTYDERTPLPETGWVRAQYLRLFGDCAFLDG